MGVKQRRAREKEGLRDEILDAARALFVKEGYESVSIRKIADKVEYATGTIYLYFRDKAEILDRICEETFARLIVRMQAIEHDSAAPLDKLRRGLRTYIHSGESTPSGRFRLPVHRAQSVLLSASMRAGMRGRP